MKQVQQTGAATVAEVIRTKLSDAELVQLAGESKGTIRQRINELALAAMFGEVSKRSHSQVALDVAVQGKGGKAKPKGKLAKVRVASYVAGNKQSMAAAKAKLTKGTKRTPTDLHATQGAILAHIVANPGLGAEQLGRDLHLSSKEMALPIKKLLANKDIKTTGTKRATRYFQYGTGPIGGARPSPSPFNGAAQHSAVAS